MVAGQRNTDSFLQLKAKLDATYSPKAYASDDFAVYGKVLAKEEHLVGKDLTYTTEQHNSDTRHYGARFRRKSKVVSKKPSRVIQCVRMVEWIMSGGGLEALRSQYLSI